MRRNSAVSTSIEGFVAPPSTLLHTSTSFPDLQLISANMGSENPENSFLISAQSAAEKIADDVLSFRIDTGVSTEGQSTAVPPELQKFNSLLATISGQLVTLQKIQVDVADLKPLKESFSEFSSKLEKVIQDTAANKQS